MREIISGSKTWAEISDKDTPDEIAAINDSIAFTNSRLKWIKNELGNIYWAIREKVKSDIYLEGTIVKIKIVEEQK